MALDHDHHAEGSVPFYPHHFLTEMVVAYGLLGLLIVTASLLPAGLEEAADPLVTPPHTKPEWYFLAIYQMLKLLPKVVGIVLQPVGILLLMLLPFLDRNPERHPRRRPYAMVGVVLGILWLISFTVWGYFS